MWSRACPSSWTLPVDGKAGRAGFDPQLCRVLALDLVLYPGALGFSFFACEVEIVAGAPRGAEMVFA